VKWWWYMVVMHVVMHVLVHVVVHVVMHVDTCGVT
jgi:hypothetical protein